MILKPDCITISYCEKYFIFCKFCQNVINLAKFNSEKHPCQEFLLVHICFYQGKLVVKCV